MEGVAEAVTTIIESEKMVFPYQELQVNHEDSNKKIHAAVCQKILSQTGISTKSLYMLSKNDNNRSRIFIPKDL